MVNQTFLVSKDKESVGNTKQSMYIVPITHTHSYTLVNPYTHTDHPCNRMDIICQHYYLVRLVFQMFIIFKNVIFK